jgi:hypothetical protein
MRRPTRTASSSGLVKFVIVGTMVFAGLCVPKQAEGYSVLAHEANIDLGLLVDERGKGSDWSG